jgi:hypothetical protein
MGREKMRAFVLAGVLTSCEGGPTQQAACKEYLQGVSDTFDYVGQAAPASKIAKSCVPAGTKAEVLRKIFVRMGHLGLHNEQPAPLLIGLAFSAVWHCDPNASYSEAIEMLGKALREGAN